MIFDVNDTLVIAGDSVTDCGRFYPVGEGTRGELGNGYPNLVNAFLNVDYPEKKIRVINSGTGGFTSRDLLNVWERDVLAHNPQWVSIMIGINDVWRQFDIPYCKSKHVYLDEYRDNVEKMITSTLPSVKGIILMTPYYMEPCKDDLMRSCMDKYGEVIKELSIKYNTMFIDTQKAFDNLFKSCHSSAIAWDRVHPNTTGHLMLAKEYMKVIEG